jgi:hypothetical protein
LEERQLKEREEKTRLREQAVMDIETFTDQRIKSNEERQVANRSVRLPRAMLKHSYHHGIGGPAQHCFVIGRRSRHHIVTLLLSLFNWPLQ